MRKNIFPTEISLGVIYILPELLFNLHRGEKIKNTESNKKDGGRVLKVKIRGSG